MNSEQTSTPAILTVGEIHDAPLTYVVEASPFARERTWSARRSAEFVRAKLSGRPSQSITFVRALETEQWLLLDGHARLVALLEARDLAARDVVLPCEMVVLGDVDWASRALVLRAELNNLTTPISWADRTALRCRVQPPSTVAGIACAAQRSITVDGPVKPGRPTTGARIHRALQQVHGLLHAWSRAAPAPGLLVRPGTTTRSQTFVEVARLVRAAAEVAQGAHMCYDDAVESATAVAQQFESLADRIRAIPGHLRVVVLYGQVCENTRFSWLPGRDVLPFLITRVQNDEWWRTFVLFLEACKARPLLWTKFLDARTEFDAARIVDDAATAAAGSQCDDVTAVICDLLAPQLVSGPIPA
jgi:hypothetical protein